MFHAQDNSPVNSTSSINSEGKSEREIILNNAKNEVLSKAAELGILKEIEDIFQSKTDNQNEKHKKELTLVDKLYKAREIIRDARILELERRLDEQDKKLAEKDAQILTQNQKIIELENRLNEKDLEIENLKNKHEIDMNNMRNQHDAEIKNLNHRIDMLENRVGKLEHCLFSVISIIKSSMEHRIQALKELKYVKDDLKKLPVIANAENILNICDKVNLESEQHGWYDISLANIESLKPLVDKIQNEADLLVKYDTLSHVYDGALNISLLESEDILKKLEDVAAAVSKTSKYRLYKTAADELLDCANDHSKNLRGREANKVLVLANELSKKATENKNAKSIQAYREVHNETSKPTLIAMYNKYIEKANKKSASGDIVGSANWLSVAVHASNKYFSK